MYVAELDFSESAWTLYYTADKYVRIRYIYKWAHLMGWRRAKRSRCSASKCAWSRRHRKCELGICWRVDSFFKVCALQFRATQEQIHGFRDALDPLGPAIKADNLRSYVRTYVRWKKATCLERNDGNVGCGTSTDDMVVLQSGAVCMVIVMQSGHVCETAWWRRLNKMQMCSKTWNKSWQWRCRWRWS